MWKAHNFTSPVHSQTGIFQHVRVILQLNQAGKGHFERMHYYKPMSKLRKIFLIGTKKSSFFSHLFQRLVHRQAH